MAVDVVTSTRFSNLRRRVTGVIGPQGFSQEKTSDGQPHLVIDAKGLSPTRDDHGRAEAGQTAVAATPAVCS